MTNTVFQLFKELNQVPRPSWHEERVADWLCQFAESHQLRYKRDAHNCMLISKAGKAGSVASKVANKSSSIFGVVGVGLELVLQFKEDYDEQLKLEAMKNNRQNIRSEFNTAANALEDYAADYVKQSVVSPMEQSVKSVEDNIAELRTTRADRSEMCVKLEKVQKEVQTLIARIHDIA